MRSASSTLIALLSGTNQYLMADLYTITLADSTVLRYASADIDITFGGHTFLASSDQSTSTPLVKRGTTRLVVGLEVDELEVTLLCGSTVRYGGIAMVLAAANGAFDGARVQLERVFMPAWGDTTPGSVVLFAGNVAAVKPSSTQIVLTVKSDLEKLNIKLPQVTYTPGCSHALYDPGCGVSKVSNTVSGTATGVPTTTVIPSALSQADHWFELGVLTMTSGAAAGAKRAVKSFVSGTITLALPLPAAPVAGDTFQIYPGCDKTQSTCNSKFSNLTRFRGFPYVPRPETIR